MPEPRTKAQRGAAAGRSGATSNGNSLSNLTAAMRYVLPAIPVDADEDALPQLQERIAQRAAAAPRGSSERRRLLALQIAVLTGARPAFVPPPAPPPAPVADDPPPPPKAPAELPKGATMTLNLDDAARMLFAGGEDEPEAKPAKAAAKLTASMDLLSAFDEHEEAATPAAEEPAEVPGDAPPAAVDLGAAFASFDDWGFDEPEAGGAAKTDDDGASVSDLPAAPQDDVWNAEPWIGPTAETADEPAGQPAAETPDVPPEVEILPPAPTPPKALRPDALAAFAALADLDDAVETEVKPLKNSGNTGDWPGLSDL